MPRSNPAALEASPEGGHGAAKKKRDGYNRDSLVWADFFWRAQKGEPASPGEIVAAIRAHGVPPEWGAAVADWLTPVHSRGAGRPQLTTAQKKKQRTDIVILSQCVRTLQAEYKREGKRAPYVTALTDVSEALTIPRETLRRLLANLNKGVLREFPLLVEHDSILPEATRTYGTRKRSPEAHLKRAKKPPDAGGPGKGKGSKKKRN